MDAGKLSFENCYVESSANILYFVVVCSSENVLTFSVQIMHTVLIINIYYCYCHNLSQLYSAKKLISYSKLLSVLQVINSNNYYRTIIL